MEWTLESSQTQGMYQEESLAMCVTILLNSFTHKSVSGDTQSEVWVDQFKDSRDSQNPVPGKHLDVTT